ncbi:MAG TPA: ABC transporter permease [Phototrophicaceae bacterium]|nr:ABC transporter permease [Phototrophicaceae bacterium]
MSQSQITITPPQPTFFNQTLTAAGRIVRQLAARPLALFGTLIVIMFLLLALVGPAIAPYEYDTIIRGAARQPPSAEYLFGTDKLGRDVFSRVLWGAREIIGIPGIATTMAVFLGMVLGLFLGYIGGWVDEVISRALDSLLAIPALLLAMVMLGTIGPSPIGIIIVIVLLYMPIVTRVIRSATLNVRSSGYIEAARLRGEPTLYILFREILPSVLPALAVEAALRFSYAIFLTASLGFLGLGVQPPSPDWGRMVNEARESYARTPWALWYPAGAIALLVIGVNLMADGLRRIFRYEGSV